jgi:hypothetical protein|tara:strand:- start:5554 stop:5925 length:372 start_codon:yes stop_codon:yes gene_type:complete
MDHSTAFQLIYDPRTNQDLVRFYFFWIFVLFSIHTIWDWLSSKTEVDSWKRFDQKTSELFSAATVTSSLFLVSIMIFGFNNHPLYNSDLTMVPLILSALAGLFTGLSGLTPKSKSLLPVPQSN